MLNRREGDVAFSVKAAASRRSLFCFRLCQTGRSPPELANIDYPGPVFVRFTLNLNQDVEYGAIAVDLI